MIYLYYIYYIYSILHDFYWSVLAVGENMLAKHGWEMLRAFIATAHSEGIWFDARDVRVRWPIYIYKKVAVGRNSTEFEFDWITVRAVSWLQPLCCSQSYSDSLYPAFYIHNAIGTISNRFLADPDIRLTKAQLEKDTYIKIWQCVAQHKMHSNICVTLLQTC